MSWADDEGFYFDEPDYSWLEEMWEEGEHRDKKGNQYKLSEMTISHLLNTIKYFKGLADISALEEEAKKRNL